MFPIHILVLEAVPRQCHAAKSLLCWGLRAIPPSSKRFPDTRFAATVERKAEIVCGTLGSEIPAQSCPHLFLSRIPNTRADPGNRLRASQCVSAASLARAECPSEPQDRARRRTPERWDEKNDRAF